MKKTLSLLIVFLVCTYSVDSNAFNLGDFANQVMGKKKKEKKKKENKIVQASPVAEKQEVKEAATNDVSQQQIAEKPETVEENCIAIKDEAKGFKIICK